MLKSVLPKVKRPRTTLENRRYNYWIAELLQGKKNIVDENEYIKARLFDMPCIGLGQTL
jgi:hypothetical protein